MKVVILFLAYLVGLLLPQTSLADEFLDLWKQWSHSQKILFLTGYSQGVESACAVLTGENAIRNVLEKHNVDVTNPRSWPVIGEIENRQNELYENCIIANGVYFTKNAEFSLEKSIKILDYAYKEKNYKISLPYLIAICGHTNDYRQCVDDAGKRVDIIK